MKTQKRAASEVLEKVVQDHSADRISLFEIKTALHERGFGLLMLLFAMPLCIPVIPPGLSSVPGIPLIIFSVQMIYGADSPWLPKWIGRITIKRVTLARMIEKGAPYLRKVEKLMQPRFLIISSQNGEKLVGFVSLFCAVSTVTPFPMTHFIPGLAILLMSFGLLSRDGLTVIVGIVTGLFGILVSSAVIILGKKAVMAIFYTIISMGN